MIWLNTGCLGRWFSSAPTPVPIKAVYLFQGHAELSLRDLQAHPEIVVVNTFDELEQHSHQKVALWIDKSATPSKHEVWLNAAPQEYYPIVLVGYSNTLYSFRDLLGLCCFAGPPLDKTMLEPGFSVIQRVETSDPTYPYATFIEGYDQTPTVETILALTNDLLEGKLISTSPAEEAGDNGGY